MRKGLLVSLFSLVASVSPLQAQLPPMVSLEPPVGLSDGPVRISPVTLNRPEPLTPRGWASAEYLNWWITRGPVNVPVVTTTVGNPALATAGTIGNPDTRILFGDSNVNYGAMYGGRLSMGYWFDSDSNFGAEASGFVFGKKTTNFSAASDSTGHPFLAIPFVTTTGEQTRLVIASPAGVPLVGAINISSTSQLWGADANGVWNIYRGCNFAVNALAGLRYLDLQEGLDIDTLTTTKSDGRPAERTTLDQFNTRNEFYGGQIGASGQYRVGRWSFDAAALLALGDTREKLYNGGSGIITINGKDIGTSTGGLYTGPNNIGNFHTNNFSVVPQLQLKVGFDITRNIRATIGYDLLYWTHVIRPGDQIDSTIGTGNPALQSNRSNLCAQGISAGLEVRW